LLDRVSGGVRAVISAWPKQSKPARRRAASAEPAARAPIKARRPAEPSSQPGRQ
jgi:hypothetical protein